LSSLGYGIPQQEIATVTTNLPGLRQTLHCLGRPLVEILPHVLLSSTVRVGVAIFSYLDRSPSDTTQDLDILAREIEAGVADLLKAARASPLPGIGTARCDPVEVRRHSPPESLTAATLRPSS
jgi:hypothetical protein